MLPSSMAVPSPMAPPRTTRGSHQVGAAPPLCALGPLATHHRACSLSCALLLLSLVSLSARLSGGITLFYILYSSTLYACFPGLRSPQSGSAAMARFITSMYVCELGAALRGGVGSALGGYFHVYARLDHAHGPALRSKV